METRTKKVKSFAEKAVEPSEANANEPKYPKPMENITDLAGIRIITFFPQTVDELDKVIRDEFEVLEKDDKAKTLEQEDRIGYQSIHYLIQLKETRACLPEYSQFASLTAELQVRTIMQHAWAEIEHDIQYKAVDARTVNIRKRFTALAGLLEIVDREFQTIQDIDAKEREDARESINKDQLQTVEITGDAFKAFLDKRLGPDDRVSKDSYELAATRVRSLGFTYLSQIADCISGFDADAVSKLYWSGWRGRQGPIYRFYALLQAGMGTNYNSESSAISILDRFRKAGIEVKSYVPIHEENEASKSIGQA